MQYQQFRNSLGRWLAALVGFILIFPFLLFGIVKVSSCQGIGGACGAVAAIAGMTLKPLGVAVILIGLMVISWKRLAGAGLSRWWFAAIVLWLIASAGLLVGLGNFWGANFGMGLLHGGFPIHLLFFLAFAAFLATEVERPPRVGASTAAWKIAAFSAGVGLLLSIRDIAMGALVIPFVGSLALQGLARATHAMPDQLRWSFFGMPSRIALWVDLAIFIAALVVIHSGASGQASAPDGHAADKPQNAL